MDMTTGVHIIRRSALSICTEAQSGQTPHLVIMSPILAELFGTAILIVLGDGVVANVVLHRTKGHNSGWIVITAGWALAVTIAVYCVNAISGAHLNPAVTIALAFHRSL